MIGSGTIVNSAAIIAGGLAGGMLKNGIPAKYKNIIMESAGLSTVIIGISGALQGIFKLSDGRSLERINIMTMILSLIAGGIIGELLKIDERLEYLSEWLQNYIKGENGVADGFAAATLLFCVGAMSIVGSIEDGLTGNASTLYAKSVLDGVMSAVFASTMGFGVIFSAASVLLYQGSITLLAGSIRPLLTEAIITQTSVVGSVLILSIGINLLGLKKIKVANLLPATFIPFVFYLAERLINSIC